MDLGNDTFMRFMIHLDGALWKYLNMDVCPIIQKFEDMMSKKSRIALKRYTSARVTKQFHEALPSQRTIFQTKILKNVWLCLLIIFFFSVSV